MLKLYQADWSPFPTRVRLLLYAKNIPFEPLNAASRFRAAPGTAPT